MDGFCEDSPPYLVPTEHPWEALARFPLRGRRILTIAGSGDIPVSLASHGPASLEAVDVSQGACFLTELKRAAYRHFTRWEFVHFFFGGMASRPLLLESLGAEPAPGLCQRSSLYRSVRQHLSPEAQAFFDPRLMASAEEKHPFAEFLRPTDMCHVSLLPPLRSDSAYRLWSSGARLNFPIYCASLENFVRSMDSCFDLIYTSNVLEYLRARIVLQASVSVFRSFIRSFWEALHRILAPGGRVGVYVFQGHETEPFARMLKELAPPRPLRYKRHLMTVTLRPKALPGAVWRHVVVFFEKTSH